MQAGDNHFILRSLGSSLTFSLGLGACDFYTFLQPLKALAFNNHVKTDSYFINIYTKRSVNVFLGVCLLNLLEIELRLSTMCCIKHLSSF